MRLTASAPVDWPRPEQFDVPWRDELRTAESELVVLAGGVVLAEGEDTSMRLIAGTHLRPGARYRLESPSIREAEVGVAIDGHPEDRQVSVHFTPPRRGLGRLRDTGMRLTVDSLDRPRRITGTSNDPYVGGHLHAAWDTDPALDLQVQLRWLSLRLVARRVADSTEQDHLQVTLDLSARKGWQLAAAPILALVKRYGRKSLQDAVDLQAQLLNQITAGTATSLSTARDPRHDIARGVHQMRTRLTEVATRLEGRSWFGRTRRRWRSEYAALPAAVWPTTVSWEKWTEREQRLSLDLERGSRRNRLERVELVVAQEEQRMRETQDREDEMVAKAVAESAAETRPITDDDLDLRWLRSPISAMRKVRADTARSTADALARVESESSAG